jgi:hypothetical protein
VTELVELALPCRLVSLEVALSPKDNASTLENLVAKAVLLGYDSASALTSLFGLPERLVSDIVTSMWEKGFLVVDLEEGVFDLSEAARSSLTDEGAIISGPRHEMQTYVLEPLTGLVLTEEDYDISPYARTGSLRVPAPGDVSPEDVAEEELIRAVQSALNRRRERGDQENVLRVSFGNRLLRPPDLVRWLHVQAVVSRDVQSQQWSVAVQDEAWDAESQLRLSRRLQRLLEDAPGSEFATALLSRARVALRKPVTLDELFASMAERVETLESVRPNQARLRHSHLTSLLSEIGQRLDQLERAHVEVTPVNNRQGQEWTVRDLIETSQHQLVLVAPEIVYRRLNPLLDDLREALGRRRVRLVVLWGRTAAEKLAGGVESALVSDLAHRFPRQVLVAPVSCQTDACLVVQDDERALVTSFSVLGDLRSTERIGVVLGPAEGSDGPAQVVTELLSWCRRAFPDWKAQRRIAVHGSEFGRPPPSAHRRRLVAEDPPDKPSERPEDAEIQLWAASWRSVLLTLLEQRVRTADRTAARVLADGENRELFWDLLRSAQRRLVVADDRLAPVVADLALASEIRECRERGAAVQLICPAPAAADTRDPFQELISGADPVPARLARAEGRVVLADGATLIASFSPLADGEGRFGHRSQRRSQVGILIDSEAFTTGMAALLQAVPAARPPEPLPLTRFTGDDSLTLELSLLREMRQARDGRQIAELVRSQLPGLDQPWAVLRNWARASVPGDILRPAIAAALAAGLAGDDDRDECTAWLIAEAWERRAFVEGAMLASFLGETQVSLARAAAAAAALEIGPLDAFLSNLLLVVAESAPGDDPSLPVAAAAALAESLLWGNPDGCAAASFLTARLPESWRALVDVVIDNYSAAEGQLPLRAALHEQTRLSMVAKLEAERMRILELVAKIEQVRTRFLFPAGRVLYGRLFAPDGLLSHVKAAANTDLEAVAALGPSLPADVRVYLNRLISQASNVEPMIWSKQPGWLRNIEEIVSTCRQIGPEALARSSVRPAADLPPGQAAIAKHLAADWDRLFSEADSLGPPWRYPLLTLMDHMEPVVTWAMGQP